jgi:hypothetical protein
MALPVNNVCATMTAPIFAILMLEHPPASVALMDLNKRFWKRPTLIVEVRPAVHDVWTQKNV